MLCTCGGFTPIQYLRTQKDGKPQTLSKKGENSEEGINPRPPRCLAPPQPPPMATPPAQAVRLRLVFDNQRILRRSLRESGLRRCWLLLPPELSTVSDLAAHIAARFRLRRSCPSCVILSVRIPSFLCVPLPLTPCISRVFFFLIGCPEICVGFARH